MPATAAAADQLEVIRSMMASGHRSVHMERHTLLLWGLASAFLILTTDLLFSPEQFDAVWHCIIAQSLYISAVLLAVGIADFRLTRAARARRGETISFVQRQVTKVWWLLIGLVVVLELGMSFFGGGYMFYPLVLALVGLAFYVQGLFSQQMLSWIGVVLIALGVGSLAIQLPFLAQKWLAASVLGFGFSILALIIDRPMLHATVGRRASFITLWLLLVALPAVAAYEIATSAGTSGLPEIPLADYVANPDAFPDAIVHLPSDTPVPVRFAIEGSLLRGDDATLPLQLAEAVAVAVRNGKLSGAYLTADGRWRQAREGLLIRITGIKAELRPQRGPEVTLQTKVETR